MHEERRNRNIKMSILLGVNRLNFFFRFQALLGIKSMSPFRTFLKCFASFLQLKISSLHCNYIEKKGPAKSSNKFLHGRKEGTNWGQVNDDRIVIFGWTNPIRMGLTDPLDLNNVSTRELKDKESPVYRAKITIICKCANMWRRRRRKVKQSLM